MIATQEKSQSVENQRPENDSATINSKSNNSNLYNVFFVDDENMILKMLARHFSTDDRLRLQTFSSGESCLKSLPLQPDVIVLDYNLSDGNDGKMDGIETLEKIKEQCPSAEVIMLSSQMEIKVAVDALKKGAVDYVIKDQVMQFSVEKALDSILRSKELKMEINELSQVIKRDKLLIKGYTVITLLLIGILSYFWIG